jgi:hypothetical protein
MKGHGRYSETLNALSVHFNAILFIAIRAIFYWATSRLMQIFQLSVAKQLIEWWHRTGNAKRLAGPCAQVMVFAAFTAKGAPLVAGRKDAVPFAARARYDGWRGFGRGRGRAHAGWPV